MKSLFFVAASIPLIAGSPHGPKESSPSASPPVAPSPQAPVSNVTTSAPRGCKALHTDREWHSADLWTKFLPSVAQRVLDPSDPNIIHPDYRVVAPDVEAVQAAVNFARDNNVRLTITNSGHDYLGRNDAPSGLALDVSGFRGVRVEHAFTPTSAGVSAPDARSEPDPDAGAHARAVHAANTTTWRAVTFGVGLTTQELNDALAPSNLFTMGAAHGSVKPAGGYGQMAGHGPFTAKYGLAADQVLEYKVVTPDGQIRVANAVSNPDLFWALRGGGGSTFGVVVQATVKAYPSPPISVLGWWANATQQDVNGTNVSPGFWDAAAYMHSALPDLNAQGVMGYYWMFRDGSMKGVFQIPDSNDDATKLKALWTPILEKMGSIPGMKAPQVKTWQYADFKAYYDARYGSAEGHMDRRLRLRGKEKEKRHGPTPDADAASMPMGILPMDSRLLAAPHLRSANLSQALRAAMPQVPMGTLLGALVSGGKAHEPADDETAVNPAWRKAYVHLICTGAGVWMCDSLRELAPDSGAYGNEASLQQPGWKEAFWGSNYERLAEIKTKYDPEMVLWASPGVGADLMEVVDGRVCRVGGTAGGKNADADADADGVAPAGDNRNLSKGDDSGDILSNFPPPDSI
ncbi:hypothetical protein LTS18_004235 [Coniosporium uncinatum]|uniref:Uncharacterized protein n=1 Tax=Coniosporium uncinatum TaxID=93489 RepID=A0ACC3E053_9PEZI|nr:hypothetical protein LTS18_004235 [Coniosporium uncinatum]